MTPAVPSADYRSALLARIPATVTSILEIGCGSGELYQRIHARSPRVRYVGYEQDPQNAQIAEKIGMDAVFSGDLESLNPRLAASAPFDCILYNKGMQAGPDLARTLQLHATWLSPQGLLVGCFPNAQHWSLFEHWIRGLPHSSCDGFLDDNFVPGFTYSGLQASVQSAQLVPWELVGHDLGSQKESHALARCLAPLLPEFGMDPATLQHQLAPRRWLLRASRQSPPALHLDAVGLSPTSQAGLAHVRMLQPLQALSRQPGVTTRFSEQGLRLLGEDGPSNRIYLLQRQPLTLPHDWANVRALMQRGYVVVMEYDDDPDRWPEIAQHHHLTFRGVHAVQVSTPALAEVIRPLNPEVAIFANAIAELPSVSAQVAKRTPIVTLFFGALNCSEDRAPYLPVINQLLVECEGMVHIDVVHDQAFFDALETQDKSFAPTLPYRDYLARMSQADLAWMPLADTAFNRKKSDLKFLEAAARGIVCVASPTVYADVISHGVNGILVDSPESLYSELNALVRDPARCRRIGASARAHVASHRMLADQIAARESWYRDLCRRRIELTERVYARVQAIAPTLTP